MGEFWSFSLGVYHAPGVESACLRLQDEWHADVNLLLYCCWRGATGRGRAAASELADLQARTAGWQRRVVMPLRALRRRLKPLAVRPPVAELRQALGQLELRAEALEQRVLEAAGGVACTEGDPAAHVCANLMTYLRVLGAEAVPAALVDALMEAALVHAGRR